MFNKCLWNYTELYRQYRPTSLKGVLSSHVLHRSLLWDSAFHPWLLDDVILPQGPRESK